MQFVYYIYNLCHDNVWTRNASSPFYDAFVDVGPWRGTSKPLDYGKGDQSVALLHPDRGKEFYLEILGRAKDEWVRLLHLKRVLLLERPTRASIRAFSVF